MKFIQGPASVWSTIGVEVFDLLTYNGATPESGHVAAIEEAEGFLEGLELMKSVGFGLRRCSLGFIRLNQMVFARLPTDFAGTKPVLYRC